MVNRINIISDTELNKELLENIMNRDVEQKFQYIGNGAKLYYQGFESKNTKKLNKYLTSQDYANFLLKNIKLKANKKIAIISLGCGNSNSEKYLLEKLEKEKIAVTYFGVDSSNEMLNLAEENLKDLKIDKKFVLADITTEIFEDEMDELLSDYEQRIFCFLGWTFGNPNQTSIVDRLYNLLQKNDLLWLDAGTRENKEATNNMLLYWQYERYLKDKKEMKSFFYPLKKIWLESSGGKMQLHMLSEEAVWALKFLFLFEVEKKQELCFRKRVIHFGRKQQIKLLYIRIYHLPTLIEFLETFTFKLVDKETKKWEIGKVHPSQLLLRK